MIDVSLEQTASMRFTAKTKAVRHAASDLASVLQTMVEAVHNYERFQFRDFDLRARADGESVAEVKKAIVSAMGRDYPWGAPHGAMAGIVSIDYWSEDSVVFEVTNFSMNISEGTGEKIDWNAGTRHRYKLSMPTETFHAILVEAKVLTADGAIDIRSYPASNEWRSKFQVSWGDEGCRNAAINQFVLSNVAKIEANMQEARAAVERYERRQLAELLEKYPDALKKPRKAKVKA